MDILEADILDPSPVRKFSRVVNKMPGGIGSTAATVTGGMDGGRRRTRRHGKVHPGLKASTLRRMLKKKGKKTTGKKSTLLKRLKE